MLKKTNGIYINQFLMFPEEKEFLLNCGSIFKILKIENRAALDQKIRYLVLLDLFTIYFILEIFHYQF